MVPPIARSRRRMDPPAAIDTPRLLTRADGLHFEGLPSTPSEVAALAPDEIVTISHGVEERASGRHSASRKERVRLADFVAALGSKRCGYMKQRCLQGLLRAAGSPRWRCSLMDRQAQSRWWWPGGAAAAAAGLAAVSSAAPSSALAAAIAAAMLGAFAAGYPVCETAYIWVGGAGESTGCHNDDEHNVLYVLHGTKRVTCWPPHCRERLRPNRKYDSGTTCCDFDASAAAACDGCGEGCARGKESCGGFGKGRYVTCPSCPSRPGYVTCPSCAAVTFVLEAGSALWLPRFWFHAVESLSVSVSVNVFMSTPYAQARWGIPRGVLAVMHALGWRRDDCVCH